MDNNHVYQTQISIWYLPTAILNSMEKRDMSSSAFLLDEHIDFIHRIMNSTSDLERDHHVKVFCVGNRDKAKEVISILKERGLYKKGVLEKFLSIFGKEINRNWYDPNVPDKVVRLPSGINEGEHRAIKIISDLQKKSDKWK